LELATVNKDFAITKVHSNRRSSVFLGVTPDKKTEALLVRSVHHNPINLDSFVKSVIDILLEDFDMV